MYLEHHFIIEGYRILVTTDDQHPKLVKKIEVFLSLDLIYIKIVKREKIKYFEIIIFRKSGVWIAV